MSFSSIEFIYIFLPITLIIFFLCHKFLGRNSSIIVLCISSLLFYGYWKIEYVFLLIGSIITNYFFGTLICNSQNHKKKILVLGITFNILLLSFFKYTDFIILNLNNFILHGINFKGVILPLAISFFTFQQISYLVDSYKSETSKHNFLEYFLFVVFFPQLIAGPIVQQKFALKQYADKNFGKFNLSKLLFGISLFVLGLFKKVFIADHLNLFASNLFESVANGHNPLFFEAWIGSFCYMFQLYFDFSGYCDMALGLGLMFGVILPINFNSPYKSLSIIDFWRRWHISLSDFLKNYIYKPFKGFIQKDSFLNLKNPRQTFYFIIFPIMITFFISGFWHGAGYTFILWGIYHGILVCVNHVFKVYNREYKILNMEQLHIKIISFLITTLSVNFGWVLFRSDSVSSAVVIFKSMLGLNGVQMTPRLIENFPIFEKIFSYPPSGLGWLGNLNSEVFIILSISVIIIYFFSNNMERFNFLNKNNNGTNFKLSFSNGVFVTCLLILSTSIFWSNITVDFLYFSF